MRVLKIHHVQLAMPAGNEERARDFYVKLLGIPEVQKPAVLALRGGVVRGRRAENPSRRRPGFSPGAEGSSGHSRSGFTSVGAAPSRGGRGGRR